MGDTAPQTDAGQSGEESFFTQAERASMADVDERTQREADRYEKAGLAPDIRSGAISTAEAKRKVRDPNAPKPPSQIQRLKMKLEAKTLECETELAANEALRRELREAKAQVSEYPHEREAVKNWPDNDDLETRAVTPAPGDVGQAQQSIVPYVFPASSASFLGIDQPVVPVGDAVFPVLSKELDVRTPAEGADADETTGTFSADVLSPSRVQAAFFYSREDRARFAGMDAALRSNLSEGLADGLDKQILAGTNGLFAGTNLPNNAQD